VNSRRIQRGDAQNRRVKIIKGFFLNRRSDLRVGAAKWFVFLDQNDAMGFADGLQNRLLIEWTYRAQVHNLGVNVVLGGEDFRRFQTRDDCASMRDERDMAALAFYFCRAERD